MLVIYSLPRLHNTVQGCWYGILGRTYSYSFHGVDYSGQNKLKYECNMTSNVTLAFLQNYILHSENGRTNFNLFSS